MEYKSKYRCSEIDAAIAESKALNSNFSQFKKNTSASLSELKTDLEELSTSKQNIIEDLDTIRSNASKGTIAVSYTQQSLTEEQKAQARNNIGAPSMEQLMAMYQELLSMINNSQNQAPTIATLDKSVLDNTKLA